MMDRNCPADAQVLAEVSYRDQLVVMLDAEIPFLVGGAYALDLYAGVSRRTKDFDLFVLPEDVPRTLAVFARSGYQTKVVADHWLAKVIGEHGVTDIIFNSGNGLCAVDPLWFAHACSCRLFDLQLKLCPPEETLWQKAFIMERDRYDGADVLHLLRGRGSTMDWQRLLDRFGDHWPVLLSHLILFRYVFPDERSVIPAWVSDTLLDRMPSQNDAAAVHPSFCRGTLLSSRQYAADVGAGGYRDARLPPVGCMTPDQIAQWEAWLASEQSR